LGELRTCIAPVADPLRRSPWLNRHLPPLAWALLRVGARPRIVVEMVALRAGRPLRFLQIGSSDGVTHDPLHATVVRHGWSGVLVEPLPWVFERLRRTYAGVAGLAFENAAVAEATGCAPIFYVQPAPGDPPWIDLTASLRREVVLKMSWSVPGIRDRIDQALVPTVTLNDLVERHELRRLDFLHVDAEGYDLEVIRQLDFDASWAPRFVLYEAKHLGAAGRAEARRRLESGGYRDVRAGPVDRFAYRPFLRVSPRAPKRITSARSG
jgi:FkbM family methyltransferase